MRKENSSNFMNAQEILADCPISTFFHLLGGRWKLPILWNLREGERRFFELQHLIPNISDKMLAQQLKKLQEIGFVSKAVFNETPIRITYQLTGKGKDLVPVLQKIMDWGLENRIMESLESHSSLHAN